MVLTHLLKRWYEDKNWSHPSFIAMTPAEHISLKVCCIILKYCHIQTNFPVNCCMSLFLSSIFQTDESNPRIIINKYQLYAMESHVKFFECILHIACAFKKIPKHIIQCLFAFSIFSLQYTYGCI